MTPKAWGKGFVVGGVFYHIVTYVVLQ